MAERYLGRLADGSRDGGFDGQLYIMQSNCGVDSVEKTKEIPITMVESGPASGFWGAAELGRLLGEPNVLALDIGGTTAKCSLIEGGHVKIISDYWIEREPPLRGLPDPGAGRRPRRDRPGRRQHRLGRRVREAARRPAVGRRGARARPPTAAAATSATTTDANLALGRINADYFCGGEIEADMDAVDRALGAIAAQLGVDRAEAARGVVRIANNNMINALKLVSVNRGYDPRDFTLVAFGGGGGDARRRARRRARDPARW